jgi:ribosomal protein L19E
MLAIVKVGFSDKVGFTHLKGEKVEFDAPYIDTLIERGLVEVADQQQASKRGNERKASKKNARDTDTDSRRG